MFAKIPRLARSSPARRGKCWEMLGNGTGLRSTLKLKNYKTKTNPALAWRGVAWRGDTGTGRVPDPYLPYSYDIFGNLEILTGNDTNLPSV